MVGSVQTIRSEYSYGYSSDDNDGIFWGQPGMEEDFRKVIYLGRANYRFRESILLGKYNISPDQLRRVINSLKKEFNGSEYHILNLNCNHFSRKLVRELTGLEIPAWINRLAVLASYIPCCVPNSVLAQPVEDQNLL
eukprot:TRINITY_DN626_c0_g1_i5.p1 TRINITY_DN626_c0_g1~~TRINITY_DN626_c0_g1_i5.p1  ORF type:complete len:137 (+),score=13.94 TRINITY_DN626_c0_g1_i5:189-599(+)